MSDARVLALAVFDVAGLGCSRRRWRGRGSCSVVSAARPVSLVAGAGGSRDLGEVGAAGALAALDLVAGDADVVGRRAPGEVDLARAETAVAVRMPGCGRRMRSGGRCLSPASSVGLDLVGGERDVVDADLVDQPREVLAVDAVAADLQRIVELAIVPVCAGERDLRPLT